MSSDPSSSPDRQERELGATLAPKFDDKGLVTAIAIDAVTKDVLMLAFMNEEAFRLTVETGIAHYFSRSRGMLWKKGETSGELQAVEEIRLDCDQDAVLLAVRVAGRGSACHNGFKSCFYRKLEGIGGPAGEARLSTVDKPLVDPSTLYGGR